ncbi:peptidase family C50-domain-containing protein [Apodospora peruviana]|uniref:separase n=1 Tax=Apodospora peruviana TaxID=516989 RepID=A0AAE0ICG6_9PEZI|nr:peptidase family C50-domain-containing protein [Apodospora peruviana]
MDTPLAQADAVRTAVSSVATCSPTATALLKSLLLPKDNTETTVPTRSDSRAATASKTSRSRATTAKSSAADKNGLSTKDKAALATHVVNATLRALGEAAKPSSTNPPTPVRRGTEDAELVKTAARNARNALRRSNSAPMTPLQPRSLNRVLTSPVATRQARSPSRSANNTNLLSAVECARVAFATLRQIHGSGKIKLPELQLESGMSALVGKLIALGLHEQAIKELRILRKRLEGSSASETKKTTKEPNATVETKNATQAFAEILDFGEVKASGATLSLIITTQIQALRVLSATKKPAYIEVAVPHLLHSNTTSPTNLLLQAAQGKDADTAKIARQMETVAQCLLSLTPNVSSKDDSLGVESRLSISPTSALELQALALEARLHWWKLASHHGDVEKDIMLPLSRCLGAFVRRSQGSGRSVYGTCFPVFNRINKLLQAQGARPSRGSKFPLAGIHQTLATLAREAGQLKDAVGWASLIRQAMDSKQESIAKSCSAAAQLLALHLKDPEKYFQDESLLQVVLDGIQGPLKGDISELDELLANVCLVRRSATNYLLALNKGEDGVFQCSDTSKELLETFILQCPRFCLRWLGKPPEPKSSTKDYLRYEQRRQVLLKSVSNILDSALMTVKTRLDQNRMAWDLMESVLTESATLLDNMGDLGTSDSPTSYYVKISHFYYLQYSILRQHAIDPKDPAPMRALRRSVECVKHRSSAEKEKAQLTIKLERMADLCRTLGRSDQALGALQSIRTSLVEDGVLKAVAQALATESPNNAWTGDERAESLSRALYSISRMEQVWIDWTLDLSEPEQAAALEHRLRFILLGSGRKQEDITLEHPTVDGLLRIYIPTRFPVRRMRVLLYLLCSAIGNSAKESELRSITRDAAQVEEQGSLEEDSGLKSFLAHMKTFYNSLTALIDGYPDPDVLGQSVSTWRSIISSCQNRTELEKSIDDVPGLLNHLQSVADFLRMRGQEQTLATVLELAADISRVAEGPRPEDSINHDAYLALQYTNLGNSSKAEQIFSRAEEYAGLHDAVPSDALASFHLAFTEHHLALGNLTKAEEHLSQARVAVGTESALQKVPRVRRKYLVAYAYYLHSLTALQRGDSHHALAHSRESVRVLYQDWVKLESRITPKSSPDASAVDDLTLRMSTMDTKQGPSTVILGPEFWKLFPWLYRNIIRLSAIYAHLGMFQETMYYAEQAQKMANSADSEFYKAGCAAWMASVFVKAASPDKALDFLHEAGNLLPDDDRSYASAGLACDVGSMYLDLKNNEGAETMIAKAEAVLENIAAAAAAPVPPESDNTTGLEEMSKLKIDPKLTRATTRKAVTKAPAKRAPRKTTAATVKAKKAIATPKPVAVVEDIRVSKLRASILVQKAASTLGRKEWAAALAILKEAMGASKATDLLPAGQVARAVCLLGISMEQMARDPVFSVIQDSTISFPAIVAASSHDRNSDRHSVAKTTPPRKTTRGNPTPATQRASSKEPSSRMYVESLREAQEYLLEAHSVATVSSDASLVHRISVMLQNVGLLLAATSSKGRMTIHNSGHTCYSVELARNLTWRRERKALVLERNAQKADGSAWPASLESTKPPRSSLGLLLDLNRFQRDYIDIIPKPWSVISVSLSDNNHDLCITKLQAGHSPFVIRLPLERASSRDADNAVFNFQQGRAELLEIIERTNQTCHDTRDMTVKGAKSAWWADREGLDGRLKELLESIEQIWLGGFRGIFSQHHRRPDLLARFQKSFLDILDKHLPSRRQVLRGRSNKTKAAAAATSASANKVTLDPRILELFVGLGDATAQDVDFDDELTDLLYFVVDILQFHGERNAYDEIDFDSMAVETFDALCAYHSAAADTEGRSDDVHTILMLDKSLHVFPWESLPCLRGCAVSRMPSLVCLRRLILEQQQQERKHKSNGEKAARPATPSSAASSGPEANEQKQQPEGHHVSAASGTFILNPSCDLKSTQTMFEQPLTSQLPATFSSSTSWKKIVARPPTEAEFEQALSSSDILLYFGHGSGAQYIRGKTIRKLDRCRATVLLMGCSSARLADAGEFEVYGPAWNYMMAGCPAVVGTLWDVTDKDIDRFAGRVLEEWGLVDQGVFSSGENSCNRRVRTSNNKGKGVAGGRGRSSLVQAVNRARGVCKFRYVNAASVVVYGIPVYVDR